METREVKDKKSWEDFISGCREKTFLQSWNWGEFQEKMGNKIWRLGVYDKEELKGLSLVTKVAAKRGTFLLIQHGPVIKNSKFQIPNSKQTPNKFQILNTLLDKLKEIAKEEKCSFIRVAPLFERNEENKKLFRSLGFREAPMHASAYEATLKLDLTLSEDELLKNMRKTTRYLIRQCLKNQDITIERRDDAAAALEYQKLNEEVAGRQGFVPFSGEYVKNEFESFIKDGQALFLFGKYKGEAAAAALVIYWSGIGFYHQAASRSKYQKLSIPYLLQWEAIKEAKRRGCAWYDFWGYVDPKKKPNHPWAGPTLFKMGFGGEVREYVRTQDYPLSRKYWLINAFEGLRKIKRGL